MNRDDTRVTIIELNYLGFCQGISFALPLARSFTYCYNSRRGRSNIWSENAVLLNKDTYFFKK